eukprot:gene17345-20693_t
MEDKLDEDRDVQLRELIVEIKALEQHHSYIDVKDDDKSDTGCSSGWSDLDFSVDECRVAVENAVDSEALRRIERRVVDYGIPVDELLVLSTSTTSAHTCKTKLNTKTWMIRCRTCCLTAMSILCVECFRRGPHLAQGHEYEIHRSNDQCTCDCGDTAYVAEEGCCDRHLPTLRGANPCHPLPLSIEQPIRVLLRLILQDISSSSPDSPLTVRIKSLIQHLHDLANTSYPAAYIVGEEFAGHSFDVSKPTLPFTESDPSALYQTRVHAAPLLPLMATHSELYFECDLLITGLLTIMPFRLAMSRTILQEYATFGYDDVSLSHLLTAVTSTASLAYAMHPDPSHNLIHLILNRIRKFVIVMANNGRETIGGYTQVIFSVHLLTTIFEKEAIIPYVAANHKTIIEALVSTLNIIQDYSPLTRELIQPDEQETLFFGKIFTAISSLEDIFSKYLPKLFKINLVFDLHFRGLMNKNNINLDEVRRYHQLCSGRLEMFTAQYLSSLLGSRHFVLLILNLYTSSFNLKQDDNPYALADMLKYFIHVNELRVSSDQPLEARYCVMHMLFTEQTGADLEVIMSVLEMSFDKQIVNELITELTKDGKIRQELWKEYDPYFSFYSRYTSDDSILSLILQITSSNKRDLINSILNNLRSFDTSLDTYIQNNDKTLSEQDRLAHRARGLAHQKAIREKMIQQQKNFSDLNISSDSDTTATTSTSEQQTCVICHEGSQPDRPLGALCKLEHSFIQQYCLEANLTPRIREARPDYVAQLPSLGATMNVSHILYIRSSLDPQHSNVSIKSCKHLIHQSCRDTYSAEPSFTCPMCDTITNALLPIDFSNTTKRTEQQETFFISFLNESFVARWTLEQNRSFLHHNHLIIPLVATNIEVLEIQTRPSYFMIEPGQPAFYALNEAEFQNQLTTIRLVYHTIRGIVCQNTKDRIAQEDLMGALYDPVLTIFFDHMSDNDIPAVALIRWAYERSISLTIGQLFDQGDEDEETKLASMYVFTETKIKENSYDEITNQIVDRLEKNLAPFIRKLYLFYHCTTTQAGTTPLDTPSGAELMTLEKFSDVNHLRKLMGLDSLRAVISSPVDAQFGQQLTWPNMIHYITPLPIELVQIPLLFTDFFFEIHARMTSQGCESTHKAMCLFCSEIICLDAECSKHTVQHVHQCYYPLGMYLSVQDTRVHIYRHIDAMYLVAIENIYFDQLNNPSTHPKHDLKLSKSAYRHVLSNWLKGTYEDKSRVITP